MGGWWGSGSCRPGPAYADRLPDYYQTTTVPEQLRHRQCHPCRTRIDTRYDLCFRHPACALSAMHYLSASPQPNYPQLAASPRREGFSKECALTTFVSSVK